MAQRFVIDININGAEGSQQGNGTGRGGSGVLTGAALGAGLSKMQKTGYDKIQDFVKERSKIMQNYTNKGVYTGPERIYVPEEAQVAKQGFFRTTWNVPLMTATNINGNPSAKVDMASASTKTGWIYENEKQIKTMAIATAWKVASTATDLQNYKSGDSYENQQRNNNMKIATVVAATIINPMVGLMFLGNEVVNAYSDYQKYTLDRKVDAVEIFNIKQIAGDVSYGQTRRGGY